MCLAHSFVRLSSCFHLGMKLELLNGLDGSGVPEVSRAGVDPQLLFTAIKSGVQPSSERGREGGQTY